MKSGLWRAIVGWFLVVAGILMVLFGAAAIGGSYLPDAQDPVSTRIAGAVIIAVGLGLAGGGVRLIRSRPRVARAPKQPRPPRRLTRVHLIGSAAALVLVAVGGVGAIVYSLSLDAEVQTFRSAHQCTTTANSGCYELHNVTITGVEISHGQGGETDTVQFTDSGSPHEVAVHPGGLDSSVLSTGAEGVATLWHGKYTNLKVAGVSFATIDNPVGQRGEWRLIGIVLLGAVLFQGSVLSAGVIYVRRRTRSMDERGLRGSADLLPVSAIETTGYPILPLVLHPSLRRSRLLVWLIALPMSLAFGFAYFTQFGRVVQWLIGGGLALLVIAGAAWQVVFVPRSAIYVDEISFGTIGGLGRRRSWPRGEAARVVLRTMDRGRRTPPLPLAIVVGPDGRARMRFSALLYDEDSFGQFAAALRVPLDVDSLDVPTPPAQLERDIPGTVSWAMRHATALGAGIAIVLIVIVVFAVGLSSGSSHR